MKLVKTLMFCAFIIVAASCGKDDTPYVEEVENDEDFPNRAIETEVNGHVVKYWAQYSFASITTDNSLIVEGATYYVDHYFYLEIREFTGEGTYQFIYDGLSEPVVSVKYVERHIRHYTYHTFISPIEPNVVAGEITISYLSENKVKGNFHFKAIEVETGDVKEITGTLNMRVYHY